MLSTFVWYTNIRWRLNFMQTSSLESGIHEKEYFLLDYVRAVLKSHVGYPCCPYSMHSSIVNFTHESFPSEWYQLSNKKRYTVWKRNNRPFQICTYFVHTTEAAGIINNGIYSVNCLHIACIFGNVTVLCPREVFYEKNLLRFSLYDSFHFGVRERSQKLILHQILQDTHGFILFNQKELIIAWSVTVWRMRA